jgi:cellulose synthase/poly-beta-1,6-N-acetylglucosamine synthase-like glycosyltransferase
VSKQKIGESVSELLFWLFLLLIVYTYFGYPALLFLASLVRKRPVRKGETTPSVSIIVAVYNEERIIREKIENTLSLNYPKEKLELIVVSDCSTDSTERIVSQFERKGVRLLSVRQRGGKDHAQKEGINRAQGEILIFTDAAAFLEKNAVLNMVRNFADSTVGCVTSADRVLPNEKKASEEGSYVRYEMLLRRLESRVCSVVGLSGSFFGIRRELCEEWSPRYTSDFLLPIRSVVSGYRAVNDSSSIAYYKTVSSFRQEFTRKVRTVAAGLAVLIHNLYILNPLRFGFFSLEVASHKLLRWLVPFFLFFVFLTNLCLLGRSELYLFFLIAQVIFYCVTGVVAIFPYLNKMRVLRIPSFFCLVNLSVLVAWLEIIVGKTHFVWEPSQRE